VCKITSAEWQKFCLTTWKFVCDRKNIIDYIIEKNVCAFVRIYQISLEINIDRV